MLSLSFAISARQQIRVPFKSRFQIRVLRSAHSYLYVHGAFVKGLGLFVLTFVFQQLSQGLQILAHFYGVNSVHSPACLYYALQYLYCFARLFLMNEAEGKLVIAIENARILEAGSFLLDINDLSPEGFRFVVAMVRLIELRQSLCYSNDGWVTG